MPRQHTLQQRLFVLTSMLAIGVVMFMTLTFVSAQLKQDTKDLRQQLTLAAQLLSIEIELQGESSTLNTLAAYPLVARACLYGKTGELATEPTSANGSCPPRLQNAQAADPILINQAVGNQGTLQVHANPGATYAGLRELAAPLVLIIGALIAVVLVASRSLAHAVVRPIAQLTRSARGFDPARPRFDTQ